MSNSEDLIVARRASGPRRLVTIAAIVGLGASIAGVAVAAIPSPGGLITGCVSHSTRVLTVLDTAKHAACPKGSTTISWHKNAVPGATGSTGATGLPGPVGPQGAIGLRGISGARGATGAKGPVGSTGPAAAAVPGYFGYSTATILKDNAPLKEGSYVEVAQTAKLPAGTYLVRADAALVAGYSLSSGFDSLSATCRIEYTGANVGIDNGDPAIRDSAAATWSVGSVDVDTVSANARIGYYCDETAPAEDVPGVAATAISAIPIRSSVAYNG